MAHSRGVAAIGLKLMPKNKKAMASPSSDNSSARPIECPQERHFPFKTSQEIRGRLSYHLSLAWHLRQTDRGPRGFLWEVL